MKLNKRMSVLLVLALLAGLFGAVTPSRVVAMEPGPKLSVFELVTSTT